MDTGIDKRPDDDPDCECHKQETQRQQLLLSHHLKPPHGLGIAFLCFQAYAERVKTTRVPTIYESAEMSTYVKGCGPKRKGFNSTIRMPARMSAAPASARTESTSPAIRYAVTQANTGSMAKISAVRVGLVQRCAQVWTVNASAVASRLVTPSAIHTWNVHAIRTGSTHQNVAAPSSAPVAICATVSKPRLLTGANRPRINI